MSERPAANQQGGDKKKKETILDLGKYLDKKIRVKFSGGREASGILKGNNIFDICLFDLLEMRRAKFNLKKNKKVLTNY